MRKIFLPFIFVGLIYANTIVVDKNAECIWIPFLGTTCIGACTAGDYVTTSISDALNNASDGDTIKICKGEYDENDLKIANSSLTITTASGKRDVTILSDSNENVFYTDSWLKDVDISHLNIEQKKNRSVFYFDGGVENWKFSDLNITSEKYGFYYKKQVDSGEVYRDVNVSSKYEGVYFKRDAWGDFNFTDVNISSSRSYGIKFNSSVGNINIKDTNLSGKKDSLYIRNNVNSLNIGSSYFHSSNYDGIYITGDVENYTVIKDLNISADDYGVYFKGNVYNDANLSGLNITSNKNCVYFYKTAGDVYVVNSELNSSGDYGIKFSDSVNKAYFNGVKIYSYDQGIYFYKAVNNNLYVYNSEINSSDNYGVYLRSTVNSVEVNSSLIAGYKDALHFEDNINNELNLTQSCLKSSGGYGLNIQGHVYGDRNITSDCFYSGKGVDYLAKSQLDIIKAPSNYWDGVTGVYDKNNIIDYTPLDKCQNGCSTSNGGTSEVNSTFNAVDYIKSGCDAKNDWDNNITTKFAGRDFNLSILARDDSGNDSEAKIEKIDFYVYQNPECSGSYRVVNICDDSDPQKPCNLITDSSGCAVKDINYSTTARCIKVHITGKAVTTDSSQTANEEESNSTDDFALRPYRYKIIGIDKNLTAGKDFNLTIEALDVKGNLIKDFNFTSAPVELNVTKELKGCKIGSFTPEKATVDFVNGEANLSFEYAEVGDINVSVREDGSDTSKVFAAVDRNNENAQTLLIGESNSTLRHFNPAYFEINAVYKNYDSENNFTYLNGDLNISSVLDINITAKNAADGNTTNYSSSCYAKNIDINITHGAVPSGLNKILYKYKDASGTVHGIYGINKNKDINITYSKNNFDGNGTASVEVYLNFDRNISNPVDPFEFNLTKIDVNDTNASGSYDLGKTARYYYGNLILDNILAVSNDFNKTYSFVVYDDNQSDTLKPPSKETAYDWYENIYHRKIDGNVSSGEIVVSSDYNASNSVSGVNVGVDSIKDGKITFDINRTDSSVNFVVVHLLSPNLKWLWYSKFGDEYNRSKNSTCLNHFCFTITWQKTNGVGEVGSGNFAGTEANVTESNTTKLGVKIFR